MRKMVNWWRRGGGMDGVITRQTDNGDFTTAQLHSKKTEFRFCTGSNSARSVSEICNVEDL